MPVVDAQLHVWGPRLGAFPWQIPSGYGDALLATTVRHYETAEIFGPREALDLMTGSSVDGAILVSPMIYGYDMEHILHCVAGFPGRFAAVGRIDHTATTVEESVQAWRAQPGAVGLRIIIGDDKQAEELTGGGFDPLLRSATKYSVPICLFAPRQLQSAASVARRFPDLQIVVDHLGLPQPPALVPESPPFRGLPDLLALASLSNVAVKVTAAPTLSCRPYPYEDIWEPLFTLIQAFGVERLAWGTDWTRVSNLVSYEESVSYVASFPSLSADERDWIMGRTVQRLFNWEPALGADRLPEARRS